MDVHNPRVEVLSRAGIAAPDDVELEIRASRRRVHIWLAFLAVFLAGSALALGYTFSRPPVYVSTATLSVSPPAQVSNAEQSAENVAAVQGHLLLGQSLLSEAVTALRTRGEAVANATELRAMLDARVVPETNMVVLEVEGPEPETLTVILQTLLETYLGRYASARAEEAESTDTAVEERLRGLEQKVIEKRAELARFREEHDIASMGRDENQALARLKGLTESLNKASEEAVAAESRLLAVEQAIAEGRPVGQEREERALANLETRVSELREELQLSLIHI